MVNIVLPVDFGEKTDHLVDAAIRFAKDINGKIFLLHVAPSDIGFAIGDMGFQYFPEIEQNEIRHELNLLKAIGEKISAAGVPCEHLLTQGVAGDLILQYAETVNADYILLGSHGRSNMYDVFVGSLTKEITRRSHIPVLVIPMH